MGLHHLDTKLSFELSSQESQTDVVLFASWHIPNKGPMKTSHDRGLE